MKYDYGFDKSYKKYIVSGIMFVAGVDYKTVAGYKKDQIEFKAYCDDLARTGQGGQSLRVPSHPMGRKDGVL